LLAPFAPHIAEELWEVTGHEGSIHAQPWPVYDSQALVQEEVEVVVQVNGKVRDRMMVPADASQQEVQDMALNLSKIQELIKGKSVVKVIVVPNKLVNIVVK
jgi:leucyl-tRNA synthetase